MTFGTYEMRQYSRFVEVKHDKYRMHAFCLFIGGSESDMRKIAEVEYTLHPTFPNPVIAKNNRDNCFALQSEAWGDFVAYARVFFRNGDYHRLEHTVRLTDNEWPMGKKETRFDSAAEEAVYKSLTEEKWEWRKLSTLARRGNLDVDQLRLVLAGFQEKKLAREAYFKSIEKEELWGATWRIGLLPECQF